LVEGFEVYKTRDQGFDQTPKFSYPLSFDEFSFYLETVNGVYLSTSSSGRGTLGFEGLIFYSREIFPIEIGHVTTQSKVLQKEQGLKVERLQQSRLFTTREMLSFSMTY